MRVWGAAFQLALEPILGSRYLGVILYSLCFVAVWIGIEEGVKAPIVTSAVIQAAIARVFLWIFAAGIALVALWVIPATWIRRSIARSNRVMPK